jgi:hypothetical protein
MIGLGNNNAKIKTYIENRPPLPFYENLISMHAIESNEIADIAQKTGNHWRKIFNVYAKVAYQLKAEQLTTWQLLRDERLLKSNSDYALIFSTPDFNMVNINALNTVHIVMGKTYATKLGLAEKAYWLNPYFAINENKRVIICPYFDYRQLSNIKITQLTQLIKQLQKI